MRQSHADVQEHYSDEEIQRKQEEQAQELLEDGPFVYHRWTYTNNLGSGESVTVLNETVDIRRLDNPAKVVEVAQFGTEHNEDELNPNLKLSDVDEVAEDYTNRSNLDIESYLQFDVELVQRGDIEMTDEFQKQIEEALDWAGGLEGRYLFKCSKVQSMEGNPFFVHNVFDISELDELTLVQYYKDDDVYGYEEIRTKIEKVPPRIYDELDENTAKEVKQQVVTNNF